MAMIIGIDEVGRGSWAGPLCVAAVAWPSHAVVAGLNDSKKVPPIKRPAMAAAIRSQAAGMGIGWVAACDIDTLGLTKALKLAAKRAMAGITAECEQIIIDGNLQLLADLRAITQIKADSTVPAVMAASIIAKVARDAYMRAIDPIYASYHFASHVGYGTRAHQAAIAQFGPCAEHRLSFSPLKAFAP